MAGSLSNITCVPLNEKIVFPISETAAGLSHFATTSTIFLAMSIKVIQPCKNNKKTNHPGKSFNFSSISLMVGIVPSILSG